MSTIRPAGFPPTAPASPAKRPESARLDAQKAFFQMAMGQAQAPAAPSLAPATAQPSAASASRPQRMPSPDADPPARVLRPGSLLDIRV